MTTSTEVVEEALKWVGTRWRHQGRTASGIDCAGLVIMVGKGLSLTDYDITNYPSRPDGTFLRHFASNLERVSVREARLGDILIFNSQNHPCHCGIMALKNGRLSVIHAHAKRHKVIHERLEEAESVTGRPIKAFRYPGLEG